MSRGLTGLQPSSTFGEFRPDGSFYRNLRIQETLTTIRYGIEARKGVVLIVGEPGIGKTTLLQKVATELSASVTSIVEVDPRVSFADVLELILDHLAVEHSGADEQTLLLTCQRELRARLRKSQIVALMFDNADHLSEQTLRHVVKHFLGGTAEDPDGTLLQLVLAGRPELKIKLSQAALLPLRGRTPIVCDIEPLNSEEIGPYIGHYLRSNNRREDFFDTRAVKRIALYTKGNPRSINAICERAQDIGALSGTVVNAELIDEIARDLSLHDTPPVRETSARFDQKFERSEPIYSARPQFAPVDNYTNVLEAVSQTFADYDDDEPWVPLKKPTKRKAGWLLVMLLLLVLGGAAAWTGPETVRDSLDYWSGRLSKTIADLQKPQTRASESQAALESLVKAEPYAPIAPADIPAPREALPVPADIPPPLDPEPASNVPQASTETSLELLRSKNRIDDPVAGDAKAQPEVPSVSNQKPRAPLPASLKEEPSRKDLQLQVIKAIANRAIIGVEVSVDGGIVYLNGRVPTERQRRAAERAARTVSDDLQVYNRIVVD
jgi:type II secretory pathway predicted ATPase ExeA